MTFSAVISTLSYRDPNSFFFPPVCLFVLTVPNMVLSLQNAAVKYFQPVLLQCTVTRYVYSDGDTVGFFVEKPSGDFEAKSLVRYEGITCNKIAPISDNIYIKCPPDSAVPYSAIKKYVMTMKKLLLTSSAHGWICCINNCSYAQSNYINLAPYSEYTCILREGKGREGIGFIY